MRRYFLIFGVIPVTALILWALFTYKAQAPTGNLNSANTNGPLKGNVNASLDKTFTEVRTKTLVTTLPVNNASLGTSPNVVQIGFSAPVGPASTITVTDSDGQPVHLGGGTFSDDRQTMTVLLQSDLSGPISVTYTACSVDNTCETGSFGFNVHD